MRRKIQSSNDMADEMRLDPRPQKMYSDVKAEDLAELIAQEKALMQNAIIRGRISLHDTSSVAAIASTYLDACTLAARFPSFEGLALALGIARQNLYRYMKDYPESDTTAFLKTFSTLCVDILNQSALKNHANPVLAIWLSKNSGTGFADNPFLSNQEPLNSDPFANRKTPAQLQAIYGDIDPDLE